MYLVRGLFQKIRPGHIGATEHRATATLSTCRGRASETSAGTVTRCDRLSSPKLRGEVFYRTAQSMAIRAKGHAQLGRDGLLLRGRSEKRRAENL